MESAEHKPAEGNWLLYPIVGLLALIIIAIGLLGFREIEEEAQEAPARGRTLAGIVTSVQPEGQGSMAVGVMVNEGRTVLISTPTEETAATLDCVALPTVEELGGATVEFHLPVSQEALTSEPAAEVYNTCWPEDEAGAYYFTITEPRGGAP